MGGLEADRADSVDGQNLRYNRRYSPGFCTKGKPRWYKSFLASIYLPSGKRDSGAIGRVGIMTVAQARDEAKRILAQVSLGNDPKYVNVIKKSSLKEFIDKNISNGQKPIINGQKIIFSVWYN